MSCQFVRCRNPETVVNWLGRDLCRRHWPRICELTDTLPPAEVRRKHTRPRRGAAKMEAARQ